MEAKGQLKVNAETGSTAGSKGATVGGIDARTAKCQHRCQALDARDQRGGTDDEADRPQAHLRHARDRGAADHLAISRIALITGRASRCTPPRCVFRRDVPTKRERTAKQFGRCGSEVTRPGVPRSPGLVASSGYARCDERTP